MNEEATKTPELLRVALIKRAQEQEAKTASQKSMNDLRHSILAGGTTSNREYDLAIVLKNSLKSDAASNWFAFERVLKEHPNQLLLIKVSWQDVKVHRMFGGNDMMECTGDLVCLLDAEPSLFLKESFEALLPVLRCLSVERGKLSNVIEYSEPVELGKMLRDTNLYRAHVGEYFPNPESYFVGNEAVIAQLDSPRNRLNASSEKLSLEVLLALGIEHIAADGQGRLAIPDQKTV